MRGKIFGAFGFVLAPAAFVLVYPPVATGQPLPPLDQAIAPAFPAAVTVGQADVPAMLSINAPSVAPIVVTSITVDPTCTDPGAPGGCDTAGAVVLASTARGTGPACAGTTFAVDGPDATGRYVFRPSATMLLVPVLGPACTIRFAFSAVGGVPGGEVRPLATITGFPVLPLITRTATGTTTMAIVAALPAVAASTEPASLRAGGSIRQRAAVTGGEVGPGTLAPTGSVTFRLYGPDDATCSRSPVAESDAVEVVDGQATSPPVVVRRAGEYRSAATYSGDRNYAPISSGCGDGVRTSVVAAGAVPATQASAPTTTVPPAPSTLPAPPVPPAPSVPLAPSGPPASAPATPGGLSPYDPVANADEVVERQASALVLLAALSAAGAAGAAGARGRGQQDGASTSDDSGGGGATEVVGVQVEAAEAGAVLAASDLLERGDRSSTWRWPGTGAVDRASLNGPARLAPQSPTLARVLNDGGYLRAIWGSVAVAMPILAVVLGVLAVRDAHGQALPPRFGLVVALAMVGVFDASAGFIAVATFVAGVALSGNLSTAAELRTMLGLALVWFSAPLIAGATRPLRREPTRRLEEHWERLADVVIASLIGAWAVQQLLQALPTLSGLELPIADRANDIALLVLAALAVRMLVETIAAHWYPNRLAQVQTPELPGSRRGQQIMAKLLTLVIFLFVAASYVGLSWQLIVGGLLFIVPQALGLVADDLPNSLTLRRVIPHGIVQIVFLLFVTGFVGVLAVDRFKDSLELIRYSFLMLSIPGFVLGMLDLFAREGPEYPLRWRHQFLGALVLMVGVLFVVGVIGVG